MLPQWILKIILGLTLLTPIIPMKHASSFKPHVVILLGPPGVGKGSQAIKIKEHLHLPHISTGDLFRENVKNQTELGIKVKSYMDQGLYVPDNITFEMLHKRLEQPDCAKGYILDGFPRTLAQAEALDHYLGQKVELDIINLTASDGVISERISGRLVCKNCGTTFHKIYNLPKNSGHCDRCNGELYQRNDDRKEVVTERLHTYKTQTEPLIAYYEKKRNFKTVDCEKSPEHVFHEVCHILDHHSEVQ